MRALNAVSAPASRKSLTVFAGLFLSSVSALAGITIKEQTATASTEYDLGTYKDLNAQVLPSGLVGPAVLKSEQNFAIPTGSPYYGTVVSQSSAYSLSAGPQALEMNVNLRGKFQGSLAGRGSEGIVAQAQTHLVFTVDAGDVASFSAEAQVADAMQSWPTLKLYRQDSGASTWTDLSMFGDGLVRSCSGCGVLGSPGNPLSLTSGTYRLDTNSLDGANLTAPGFGNDLKVVVSIGGASAPSVPEPASVLLMGLGLVALGAVSRRRGA